MPQLMKVEVQPKDFFEELIAHYENAGGKKILINGKFV